MADELTLIKLGVSKEWISKMISSGAKKVHPEKLRAFSARQGAAVSKRAPNESAALEALLKGVSTKNEGLVGLADRVLKPLGKRRHAQDVSGKLWREGARQRLSDAGSSIGVRQAHLLG